MNIGVVARTTRALTPQFSAFGSSDDPDQIFNCCLRSGAKFHYSFAAIPLRKPDNLYALLFHFLRQFSEARRAPSYRNPPVCRLGWLGFAT